MATIDNPAPWLGLDWSGQWQLSISLACEMVGYANTNLKYAESEKKKRFESVSKLSVNFFFTEPYSLTLLLTSTHGRGLR